MNWKEFWNDRGKNEDRFAQVARTGGQLPHHEDILGTIVRHIADLLDLNSDDVLLDVCCGNGLLTNELAKYCKKITGMDFSEVQIANAKKNFPEIEFFYADAMKLKNAELGMMKGEFSKLNLYFSFQYFETFEQGKLVIENLLELVRPGGKILLGDIPDSTKFFVYYNSFARIMQLIKQTLQNKNNMGKFWSERELKLICAQLNVKGEKLVQPVYLPYSHYRMDWLISV